MTLHILSQQNTVLNKFIAEIRDKRIQRDSMRFRRNMERIGEITAYEISKAFSYKPCVVDSRFIPHFLASIAMLIIPPVKTSEPPSETSPIKAQSDKSSVIILFTARMAAIIVKSYSEPHFRTSAGAKLTVSF